MIICILPFYYHFLKIFSCERSLECIAADQVCNGQVDCDDQSDEYGCPDRKYTRNHKFTIINILCLTYQCNAHAHHRISLHQQNFISAVKFFSQLHM